MVTLLQSIVTGLGTGAIYAVIALGFSVVFKTTRVVNFAHGEYLVIAGIMGSILTRDLGWPMFVVWLAVIFMGVVMGAGTELVIFRALGRPDPLVMTLGSVALGLIVGAVLLVLTRGATYGMEPLTQGGFKLMGVTLTAQMLWNVVIVVVVTVLLILFFAHTKRGIALQAAADDRETASIFGISPGMTTMWSFAIAGGLGALAGLMITPVIPVTAAMGLLLGIKGFAAAMLGGLGSMQGALVGGLAIGLAESFAASYLSGLLAGVVAFIVLLVVLFFKPSGIFKEVAVERV